MDDDRFQYQPRCSVAGCENRASYKVGAVWTDGTSRELKNYGLACDEHRAELLERARASRASIKTAEGETVGPVELYQLISGRRDSQLPRASL